MGTYVIHKAGPNTTVTGDRYWKPSYQSEVTLTSPFPPSVVSTFDIRLPKYVSYLLNLCLCVVYETASALLSLIGDLRCLVSNLRQKTYHMTMLFEPRNKKILVNLYICAYVISGLNIIERPNCTTPRPTVTDTSNTGRTAAGCIRNGNLFLIVEWPLNLQRILGSFWILFGVGNKASVS